MQLKGGLEPYPEEKTIVCHCFKQCEREKMHMVDALLEANSIYTTNRRRRVWWARLIEGGPG